MQPERRGVSRKRQEGLSYIQFETGSGGIVLNASEEGLAFQAAAPVVQSDQLRFDISPSPNHRIDVIGEIVWLDGTKKSGGLRFRDLSSVTREQIRDWLRQGSEPQTPQGEFALPGKEVAFFGEFEPPGTPGESQREVIPERAVGAPLHTLRPRVWPPSARARERASRHTPFSIYQWRPMRGVATGFLICLLVLTPFLAVQDFRIEIANSLIHLGERLKGNSHLQSQTPVSMPSSSPATADPLPPAAPTADTNATSEIPVAASPVKSTPEPPIESSPAPPNSVPKSVETSRLESKSTPRRVPGPCAVRGRSCLVQQLWSAIGNGDIGAEVILADLYVRGDGVVRNCEQARVLLTAAAKSGNTEASRKLHELRKNRCP
jgi:hypothetical protein